MSRHYIFLFSFCTLQVGRNTLLPMTNSLHLKAAKTQEDIMKEVLKDQHQQHKGATGEGAQREVEEMMEDQEEAAELQDEEAAAAT